MKNIRILLVDDQSLFREALRTLLSLQPDFDIVAEAADGEQATAEAATHQPDVVLMDLRMPVLGGVAATRRITATGTATRVIVLTTFDEDAYVEAALRAGVSGFLLKVAPPERLIDAVRTVAKGGGLLDPSVTLRVIETFSATAPLRDQNVAALTGLTEREKDVLRLIARGMSNAEICAALFISLATVKTHVSRVIAKLGVESRTQVAALVLRNDPEHG